MTVQTSWEVPGDFRDLNVWLLAKLMEDPDRDERALRDDFIRGFYGPAARDIRRYLALLDRVTRNPPPLGAEVNASAYTFLDASFLEKAQAIFDAAERAAGDDPVVGRRVRHARVSLDYATLVRWHEIVVAREFSGRRRGGTALDRATVCARYERTCREQIEFRLPPSAQEREWNRIQDMREDLRP